MQNVAEKLKNRSRVYLWIKKSEILPGLLLLYVQVKDYQNILKQKF